MAEAMEDLPANSVPVPEGQPQVHTGDECHSDAEAGTNSASLSSGRGKWPRICANGRQLRDISNNALRALQAANDPLVLFARSGMIVAVTRDDS